MPSLSAPLPRRRALGLLGASALLPWLPARAVAAPQRWRLAGAYPENNFQSLTTRIFAEDLAIASGNRFVIDIYANGSLLPHDRIADAVASGEVDLGEVRLAWLGPRLPAAEVDSVPFLATNYQEARRLWQASHGIFQLTFGPLGLVPLMAVPWPPVGLASRQPLASAADLAGRRFVAAGGMTQRFAELLGAQPVSTAALQSGQFDAFFTPAGDVAARATPGQALYYYDIGAWLPKNAVIMSQRLYETLTTKDQELLNGVAEMAEARGWAASEQEHRYRLTSLAGQGVIIEQPSPALLEGLREAGYQVAVEWLARAGFYGEELLRAYRA